MDEDGKDIQQITDNYSGIIRIHPKGDLSGGVRSKIKELNTRWEILNGTVHETLRNV